MNTIHLPSNPKRIQEKTSSGKISTPSKNSNTSILTDATSPVSPFILWILDDEGAFLFLEGTGKSSLGLAKDDVLGNSYVDVFADCLPIVESIRDAYTKNSSHISVNFKGHTLDVWNYSYTDHKISDSGIIGIASNIDAQLQHQTEHDVINQLTAALNKVNKRAELISIIFNHMEVLVPISAAALEIFSEDPDVSIIEYSSGAWMNMQGRKMNRRKDIWPLDEAVQAVLGGNIFLGNVPEFDMLTDPAFGISEDNSVFGIPMKAENQLIGVFWARCLSKIESKEVSIFSAISTLAGNAINRISMLEKTIRTVGYLSAFHDVERAIAGSFDLRLTLGVVLEKVSSQLRTDSSHILLLNPHTQTLEFKVARGYSTKFSKLPPIYLSDCLAGESVIARETIAINNLQSLNKSFVILSSLLSEGLNSYMGIPLIARGQVKGVLEIYRRIPFSFDQEGKDFLNTLTAQTAMAIDNAELFDNLQQTNVDLSIAFSETLKGWSRSLDISKPSSNGLAQNMTTLALLLGKTMGMNKNELVHLSRGAILHDIGKFGVPDQVLSKSASLSEEEWDLIRTHPNYAFELISPITYLRAAVDVPYCHHENWDGGGYPRGLKGEQIPLAARVFTLANVWYILQSNRPYRPAMSANEALEIIKSERGKQFDPNIVDTFLRLYKTPGSVPLI